MTDPQTPLTEAGRRLFRANPADAVREAEEWELAEVSPAAVLAIEAEAAAAEREKVAALVAAARWLLTEADHPAMLPSSVDHGGIDNLHRCECMDHRRARAALAAALEADDHYPGCDRNPCRCAGVTVKPDPDR